MTSQSIGLRVAGIVFGLGALVQLTRLVIRPNIIINGTHQLPLWPSYILFLLLGGLCWWMFSLSCEHHSRHTGAPTGHGPKNTGGPMNGVTGA